jgi:cAMP-binding proteins - catabolite gene activator and regulatory subunit of cAMP-dependent protein kinases
MISPELLRRYVFFRNLQEPQLKAIAMLADEVTVAVGETLFEIDQNADTLYLLLEGRIDLKYLVVDRDDPTNRQVYDVGEINPGEAFGISALIEPYRYTSSATAGQESRVLKIDAQSAARVLH